MSRHRTTRESLGIFWQGEELDGFTAYGYWPRGRTPQPALDLEAWPEVESRVSSLGGDHWTVWVCDVRVHVWPVAASWRELVVGTLDQFLAAGAAVAWCATEGAFADPPALFDPRHMSGSVWAARVKGHGEVFEPPGLNEQFNTLTDDQLNRLGVAAGLGSADA